MRAERGYAYLDLASEKDVDHLLKLGRVKMGEKLVSGSSNLHFDIIHYQSKLSSVMNLCLLP